MITIYAANKSAYLADIHEGHVFPEVRNGIPLHPSEILEWCETIPLDEDVSMVTVSEHIILYFCKQIMDGNLDMTDLTLYQVYEVPYQPMYTIDKRHIRVDFDGELIDHWAGGFFDERLNLLF